jgi:subtilase family serine protease
MSKGYSRKKIIPLISSIALSLFSVQALALPNTLLPPGWTARPPIHLRSPIATLLPSGMTPAQIKQAYNFPTNYQGAGEVIAIVDAYDDPNIEADLNTFSTQLLLHKNVCFR